MLLVVKTTRYMLSLCAREGHTQFQFSGMLLGKGVGMEGGRERRKEKMREVKRRVEKEREGETK